MSIIGSESADVLADGATNKAYTAAEQTKLAGLGLDLSAIQTGGDLTLPQSDATNYTDIPGLSFTLPLGTYLLTGYVEYEAATAADIRFRFATGGGLAFSGSWGHGGLVNSATAVTGNVGRGAGAWSTAAGICGGAGVGTPLHIKPAGRLVVTTAGTMKMQATQGTADASDVKVRNGALRFTKVS